MTVIPIPGNALDDILHELRTVGFDPFPFPAGADAEIRDGLPAETVFTEAGLHIGQAAAGGQRNEQHAGTAGKRQRRKSRQLTGS